MKPTDQEYLAEWENVSKSINEIDDERFESLLDKHVMSSSESRLEYWIEKCKSDWGEMRDKLNRIRSSTAFAPKEHWKDVKSIVECFKDTKERLLSPDAPLKACFEGISVTLILPLKLENWSTSFMSRLLRALKSAKSLTASSTSVKPFERKRAMIQVGLERWKSCWLTSPMAARSFNSRRKDTPWILARLLWPWLHRRWRARLNQPVMKDVIPLYFPISEAYPASGANAPQKIYATFKELAKLLFKSAEADLKDLNKIPLSAGELKNNLDQEYWVLGLLQALLALFENLLSSPPETWMSVYAKQFSLSFKQVSLRTFIAHPALKKFCLFLDEFKADNWVVFVRNLSRAAGLRCIVSNTNTRIANVIGRETASGAAAKVVWAVVIGRLNGASLKILKSDPDLDFDGSIARIREHRGGHLHRLRTRFLNIFIGKKVDPVLKFLDSLDESFFENLRPGMAVFFVKALKTFCDEDLGELPSNFHFGALLDSILASLSIQLIGRKPRLNEKPSAVLGKVGLLVAQSYSSLSTKGEAVASDIAALCNPRSHLENHLYYLANPWKADEWAFLTFAECDERGNKLLRVIGTSNDKLVEWKMEYSYFRKEELITYLACSCVSYKHTISRVLHDANLRITGSGDYVYNVTNEEAPSNSGNVLEVTVAACIAEASHQNHDQIFTTGGVDGMDFLRNLVRNLIYVDKYSAYSPVFIHIPSASKFDMSKFLNSCRIPFIYGWNRSVPELDKWCDSAQSCLFSDFIRCSNRAQIDGRFNFWIGKEKKSRVAVVECKIYRNGISAPKLQEILEKCLKTKNVGLSLVVGTYFSLKSRDSSNQTTSNPMKIDSQTEIQAMKDHLRDEESDEEAQSRKVSFLAFCREKGINVYRLQPLAFDCEYDYSLVPFEPSFTIHSQPKLNCVVLEQTVINKREGEKVEAKRSFEGDNDMI